MTATAKQLSETSALIVGGTSGIGLAAARALLAAGLPRLRIVGRNPERAALAVDDLSRGFEEAEVGALVLDCSEAEASEEMADAAARAMGGIDLLVCSPGGSNLPELLFRQPIAQINETLRQDLAPTLNACRAALPAMMEAGGGRILNVASDAGKVATPGETVIGAVMSAIIQFTRGLAIEGKRNGLRANAITPLPGGGHGAHRTLDGRGHLLQETLREGTASGGPRPHHRRRPSPADRFPGGAGGGKDHRPGDLRERRHLRSLAIHQRFLAGR